jgi:hypothetical protein
MVFAKLRKDLFTASASANEADIVAPFGAIEKTKRLTARMSLSIRRECFLSLGV